MSTFDNYLRERVANKDDPNLPQFARNKLQTYDFCKKHDILTPKVFARIDDIQSYGFENLPEKFVLKPDKFWSSIGVFILKKQGKKFLEIKTGKIYSSEEIIGECQKVNDDYFERENDELQFFVEEFIEDELDKIPYDYKIFSFYGEVGLVQQTNRNTNPKRLVFFDSNFEPLDFESVGLNHPDRFARGEHVKPKCYNQILDIAKKTSFNLGMAFVRVDIMNNSENAYLGEFTLFPGMTLSGTALCYSPVYNMKMGQLWREAIKRIELDKAA